MLSNSGQTKAKTPVNQDDPRVKRTRKLLQDTFVQLLAEKSFDAITVQDIADRSTINRATFYAHFVDKYDLFSQFARDWFRQALHIHLPPDAEFSRDNLQLLLQTTMEAMAEMNDHCRPTDALKPLVMSAVQEELSAVLGEWLRGLPRNNHLEVSLETAVASVSWAIFGSSVSWSQSDDRAPAGQAANEIADLLFAGLDGFR